MGLLKKFRTLLHTGSLKQRDGEDKEEEAVHVAVRPASMTSGRTLPPANQAMFTSQLGSPSNTVHRADSGWLAAVPRVESVTTTTLPGSRFETTIIERQGSTVVLQGVKTMKPDSDDEADDCDASSRQGSIQATPSPHRPGSLSPASTSSRYIPTLSPPTASPGNPASLPAMPAAFRRKPNRVASLPMLLDAAGGRAMPRAPQPFLPNGVPEPEFIGPQEPERRRRGPPNRSESLKYLLNLDQYGFNPDVSVHDAREASGQVTPPGSLEDIMSADGKTYSILAVSPALPHRMRRPRWSVNDYVLLKQLHHGYASDVYQARCKLSGEVVALKVYKLAEQGDIQRMQLYREIKLHAALRHSNIIQYYACFLEHNRVVLVQEFATGGDLLRVVYKCGGRLCERQAVNLVLQPFLTALHYLHTQGIVHRDIKPENVLFGEGKILKLADFGLAISLREERANTRAGTLDYMAPEVLRCPTKKTPDENKDNPHSAHYHQAVDVWAVGVFAYELLVGAPPFKAAQMLDTARNIIHAPVAFPDTVSELAKDFIGRALAKDQRDRLTVLEMLHHPWVTMFQRRASVRMLHARSDSLRQLVPSATGLENNTSSGYMTNAHGGDIAGAPNSRQHSASRSRNESGSSHVQYGTHGTHAPGGGVLQPSQAAAAAAAAAAQRGRRSYERSSLTAVPAAGGGGGGGPHSGSGLHGRVLHSASHQHPHQHPQQQEEDPQTHTGVPPGAASGGAVRRASRLALMAGVGDAAGGGGASGASLRASAERMRLTRMVPRDGSEC